MNWIKDIDRIEKMNVGDSSSIGIMALPRCLGGDLREASAGLLPKYLYIHIKGSSSRLNR